MREVPQRNRPLLLGHRGARARRAIPENTTASFDQALADGCDGFEFDVRLAADGTAVVCHDAEFEGVEISGASAQELPGLPKLEDILTRYKDRAFLDIELKVSGIEKRAADLLRKHPPGSGFVVSSFLPEVLCAIHAEDSAIPLGLICETDAELRRWSKLPVEFVIPHQSMANRALIERLRRAGKKVLLWTVNHAAEMMRFRDEGVDGIISDDTELLCRTLAR
jgi:glycerophosphoryl diester phosphodiesterase